MLAQDAEHIFTGKHKATRLNQIKSACNVPFFCCIANKLYTMGTSKNSVRFLEVPNTVALLLNYIFFEPAQSETEAFLTLHFFISLGYIPLYFLKQVLNLL